MKIAVDTKPLKIGHKVRGIGVYTRSLMDALKKKGGVKIVSPESEHDVLHVPYFDLFFDTLRIGKKPTVVTVYDTIPLIYPEHYPAGIKGKINFFKQKRKLKDTAAIITISETSKKDIVRFLDVPGEKIYVTHLAPGNIFRKLEDGNWKMEITKRYGLPERFVLYVGDVNYNKNVLGLVRACEKISIPVVIVGKQAAEKDFDRTHIENWPLVQLIEEYADAPDVIRLGFVSEEELIKIYNLASVYSQPSLYEGFGLPVLEAMVCGVPVVAAKTQALVEVGEDAAVFVDPEDPSDIARGLKKVLEDESLHRDLSKKGIERARRFSWERVADETIRVYKEVVS